MIDLRSDTLTKPTQQMMQSIHEAKLGDDGRTGTNGKGEDPTVNQLERLAAEVTGKDDALFCNNGTMANTVAILTHCIRGEYVGVDRYSHIYQTEKAVFMEAYFGLNATFYQSDDMGKPIMEQLNGLLSESQVQLLCLENPFSNRGGTCLSVEDTKLVCQKANDYLIPVHLDGARIFNAAFQLNVSVKKLVEPVTTVQFCLSKGLGAPFGSMLCGSKAFIRKARDIRKLLGGGMRQAGIMAAAGIEALKDLQPIQVDNENALLLAQLIAGNTKFGLNIKSVQTNIVVIDVPPGHSTAKDVENELETRGLKVKAISARKIRMTIHKGISKTDIQKAAKTINNYFG